MSRRHGVSPPLGPEVRRVESGTCFDGNVLGYLGGLACIVAGLVLVENTDVVLDLFGWRCGSTTIRTACAMTRALCWFSHSRSAVETPLRSVSFRPESKTFSRSSCSECASQTSPDSSSIMLSDNRVGPPNVFTTPAAFLKLTFRSLIWLSIRLTREWISLCGISSLTRTTCVETNGYRYG